MGLLQTPCHLGIGRLNFSSYRAFNEKYPKKVFDNEAFSRLSQVRSNENTLLYLNADA
jgi:hypothetical protein